MASISPQHLNPLAAGTITIVVVSIIGLGIVNYLANKG